MKAGDTLAIIDAPDVKAKMMQAESAENAAAAMSEMANNGARKEQVRAAYALLQQAKAGLDIAKKSYERVQRLFDEGVMTAQKRDEAFANYKALEAQTKAAQSQYDMAVNGARQEEKKAAAAQVDRAKGAVEEVNSYINETMQIAQMEGESVSFSYTPTISCEKWDRVWAVGDYTNKVYVKGVKVDTPVVTTTVTTPERVTVHTTETTTTTKK